MMLRCQSQAIVNTTLRRGSSTPRMMKALPLAIDAMSQSKFIPKKPVSAVTGRKIRDTSVRRLICSPCLRAISAEKSWMMFDVFHLVGVVVELRGPTDSRAPHRLDPGRRRANRTEIAIEARRYRLQPL